MTIDEIRQHLGRVDSAFGLAAVLFEAALSAEHAKIDSPSRSIPAKELVDIYGGRREGLRSRGVTMEGLDALVTVLQSKPSARWTVVGVSGGAYWGALFIPDDGSATACIAKPSK